jgi:hypothetical protein
VKLAEFSETKQIQSVVASLVRNPANQSDEWLKEATRILGRIHGAALYRNGENLIAGSGFETFGADGLPSGWQRRDTGTREGNKSATWTAATGEKEFHGGRQSVRLTASADCDTTLNADVAVKPNTQYRLSGWVKTKNLSGRITLGEVSSKAETEIVRRRDSDWAEIETDFNSGDHTQAGTDGPAPGPAQTGGEGFRGGSHGRTVSEIDSDARRGCKRRGWRCSTTTCQSFWPAMPI